MHVASLRYACVSCCLERKRTVVWLGNEHGSVGEVGVHLQVSLGVGGAIGGVAGEHKQHARLERVQRGPQSAQQHRHPSARIRLGQLTSLFHGSFLEVPCACIASRSRKEGNDAMMQTCAGKSQQEGWRGLRTCSRP